MKSFFTKNLFVIILFFSLSNFVSAECNFITDIGGKFTPQMQEEYGHIYYDGDSNLGILVASTEDECPEDRIKEASVVYSFLDNELASIHIVANNEETENEVTNSFSIMDYAIRTYGPIDTGADRQFYNDYNIWEKNNQIVSYKRDINLKIFQEEILITNKKYQKELFNNKMSEEIVFEDDGQN